MGMNIHDARGDPSAFRIYDHELLSILTLESN
jgi:hypothetical protein